MSLKIIEDEILNFFLPSDKPEVMAIKGEWGIGKTFFWKQFFGKNKDKIELKRYSYVSLFGINSLDAFKFTIFENTIDCKIIGEEPSVATFKNNLISLIKPLGKRLSFLVKGVPVIKTFSSKIDAIAFFSLRSTLICIDDLERKGEKLSIKDVMGLVSLLKEQKKCKVVLILNDREEGLQEYRKYCEKVIDIELAFKPSPDECASIAYSGEKPYHSKLKERTTKLGIRNIRILFKIERLVALSSPLVENFEPEILERLISSLVLYTWSYYGSNSGDPEVPTLDFITGEYNSLSLNSDEKLDEQEKEWGNFLSRYDYGYTDELDLLLVKAVKTGFFVENELKKKADIKNQQILASKSGESFRARWNLLNDSFDDNQDEVINSLYKGFKNNHQYLAPTDLDATVLLFKKLGEKKKASEVIDIYIENYIENRKNKTEPFDITEIKSPFLKNNEIVTKFKEAYDRLVPQETTVKQVLERIAGKNSWGPNDQAVLANTSIEEYHRLLKSERGHRLSSFIDTCLKFGNITNATDQQKEVARKTTEALKKIASESKINQIRVKRLGINLDDG